jgi:hypothetical protein
MSDKKPKPADSGFKDLQLKIRKELLLRYTVGDLQLFVYAIAYGATAANLAASSYIPPDDAEALHRVITEWLKDYQI